ncbi:MAG: hypothetical protein ABSF26_24755 [Thermoguttaceae bacterium]
MTSAEDDALAAGIVVFYPCESLRRQIRTWAGKHPDRRIETALGRSAREIGNVVRGADMALLDATEDHAQAIDAFSQALTCLGAEGTAVYTEQMHEGLELFVRRQGAPLLFGPLDEQQWEGFFERTLPLRHRRHSWRRVA